MKKFLLSLVALLTALSMSAKEDITDPQTIEFASAWTWVNIKGYATGELIKDEANSTCDDSGLVYTDMSAYEYVVLTYTSTTEVKLITQYKCTGEIGQWGPNFNVGEVVISAAPKGGIATLKLDAEGKKTINCVALQNTGAAGQMEIKAMYFATEAEYQDAMAGNTTTTTALWEGEQTMDNNWPSVQIPAAKFASMKAGDAIIVTISKADNSINTGWEWGPQVFINADWSTLFSAVNLNDGATDQKVKFVVTDEEIEKIKAVSELEIQGMNVIVSKVEIETGEALPEWEKEGKSIAFDADGVIKASEFNGYTDDAKVEFVFSCSNPSAYTGWGACSVSSIDGSTLEALPASSFGIKDATTTITAYLGDLKEALNTKSAWGTYGLYWNIWGFGSDCENARVSCTIYEMKDAKGEKFQAKADETALYVIGNVGTNDWDFSNGDITLPFNSALGQYVGVIEVANSWDGNGWFVISQVLGTAEEKAADDWTNFNSYRLSVSADYGTLNETATLVQGVDQSFKLPAGTYTLYVDLNAMTIRIEEGNTPVQSVSVAGAKSGKFVENNTIVIYKNGKKFNVAGSQIK